MRRLSGLESFFLSAETPTNLLHVGAITVFDPSTAPAGSPDPYEALCRVLEERIGLLAPFRRRLVGVPGGIDHARWVEDADFEVRHHVLRAALPPPGGGAEMARFAADVMSRPLDRDRPLWEIHLVEGLQGGMIGSVVKIHHACIDGLTGVELTANMMDVTPEVRAIDDLPVLQTDERPGAPALVLEALRGAGSRLPAAARALAGTARAVRGLHLRGRGGVDTAPGLLDASRTRLGGRVSRRRAIGVATVEREEVERIREATGATMNDLVLALTAAALRDHLDAAGALPEDPLVAFVPVALKDQRGEGHDESVNRLSGMLVSLATTVDDPVARLKAVSSSARQAKEQEQQVGGSLFGTLADLMVPLVAGPFTRGLAAVGTRLGWPPWDVVVSSFPGSPVPLYCAGSRLVAYHPLGPVVDGAPLNVTATTYGDEVTFGLLACEDAVPDVEALAARLPDATRELAKLTAA